MKILKLFLSLSIAILFTNCDGDDSIKSPSFRHVEILNMDNIINFHTLIDSPTAHSGKKICHLDSGYNYGLCYAFTIPDSLIGKKIGVSLNAWVRTGDLNNNCDIICSAVAKDSLVLWLGFGAKEVMLSPNEWSNVNKTIYLMPDKTLKPNTVINVMVNNIDAKSFFDADDIVITYFEVED